MVVTLIGKKYLQKITLPKSVEGNYWISDKNNGIEKKLINIESRNGEWVVSSNNYVKLIDLKNIDFTADELKIPRKDNIILDKVILKEYRFFGVCFGNSNQLFTIYCTPFFDNTFLRFNVKETKEIIIGKSTNCHISYRNPLVKNIHAKMYFINGRWNIENFDNNFGTFVNSKPIVENKKILFNGDVIFIMGLKIIIIGNSLFINSLANRVKLKSNFVLNAQKIKLKIDTLKSDNLKDTEIELGVKSKYFFRSPRMMNIIQREKIKIDAPPGLQNRDEMPLILSIGSSFAMGIMMLVSMYNTIDGRVTGTTTMKQTITSLITIVTMLIAMLLIPILTKRYERKRKKQNEEKRQSKYKKYLKSKINKINEILEKQRNTLYKNYISEEECIEIVLNRGDRLWERKIEDYDFLNFRFGTGNISSSIDIDAPEESFRLEEDNLFNLLNEIKNKAKILENVPIVVSLTERNILALISREENIMNKIMQNIIIQLITFHSYDELKIVLLLKEETKKNWESMKILPYIWSNERDIRFFADNYADMLEISKYLEEEYKERNTKNSGGLIKDEKDYKKFYPYYLIITDDYKKVSTLKIINEILISERNLGFSLICMTDDLKNLPNACNTFVSIKENKGIIFDNELDSGTEIEFSFDLSSTLFLEKVFSKVANIPIKYTKSSKFDLPSNYTFLEMYNVGRIEQLNILERWNKNDSTISLQAPIGIDTSGKTMVLDLHEKYHGPHGLIAGSTGSGKSEFIITYVLSLAINYSPDDVTMILIDYKGGGLAGAFQKGNIKLPHLVGTITNIDTMRLQRSLASIKSEVRRRQIIFNEAKSKIDEGTMDIYKYQKLYHQGIVDKPVSHLLIICDEFAELKQQVSEFMDDLISISRIGRSLGIHLILATQKPAGIVNDQIRSNSKFAICLKVQTKEDSRDVIAIPDAASLKNQGQFFMKVGNDEYFELGQSAWTGATYIPSDMVKQKIDTSIEFISDIGTTIKSVDDIVTNNVEKDGEQLTNILKYICNLAKMEKIQAEQLWLDDIPENIYVDDLKKKYPVKSKQKNIIYPIIGEYDDPDNQRQGIVRLNCSSDGNILIYGNAVSGKETLLSTLTYDLITSYRSEDVWMYLLDFGSESLKLFKDSPQVGDVVLIEEEDKIIRFFNIIQSEIKVRKQLLSDYNGDRELYIKETGNSMPAIVCIINNYESFAELYNQKYEEIFTTLTREGTKYGIIFIVTISSYTDMRYRLSHNFKNKITLQLNNQNDYSNILEGVGKKRPSNIFGRGLIPLNDGIYEFQTAKIYEPELYNQKIKEAIEIAKESNKINAPTVPVLPDKLRFDDVKQLLKGLSKVPIGISKEELKIVTYDFKKNPINIISTKDIVLIGRYMANLVQEFQNIKECNLVLLDTEGLVTNKEKLKENWEDLILQLKVMTENMLKEVKIKHTLCIIIGIDKLFTEVGITEQQFNGIIENAVNTNKYSFLIGDTANKLRTHEFEPWYKNYVQKDNGIWIGRGIDDQYTFNIGLNRRNLINNCDCSFGYVINQSEYTYIKLLGMWEQEENNG